MAVTPKLSLLPDTLDLELYAGDGVMLKLSVTDNADAPLPVEGEILAQIRKTRKDPDVVAEFAVDLIQGEEGFFFISLTGEQTAGMVGEKPFKGVWDVQWKRPDEEPITLVQGKVECGADVSR